MEAAKVRERPFVDTKIIYCTDPYSFFHPTFKPLSVQDDDIIDIDLVSTLHYVCVRRMLHHFHCSEINRAAQENVVMAGDDPPTYIS